MMLLQFLAGLAVIIGGLPVAYSGLTRQSSVLWHILMLAFIMTGIAMVIESVLNHFWPIPPVVAAGGLGVFLMCKGRSMRDFLHRQ